MQGKPAVSVVIPLFNKGPHIARAIKSVLDQTFQDFEIIVVDDGSTDNGAEVVRSFEDPRIQLIQQENCGVSVARNRGIEISQAELIAFLDADDEWLPDHLETLLRLYEKYPEAGAYTTAYLIRYPNSRIKTPRYYAIPGKPWEGLIPNYFRSCALGLPPICNSTIGIPKSILEEMHGFNENIWWGEDDDLWCRIALKYPIAFSWNGIGIYHTEAMNRLCNRREPIKEHILLNAAKGAMDEGKIPSEISEYLKMHLDKKIIQIAWINYLANRPDLARKNLKCCLTDKYRKEKYWILLWTFIPVIFFYLLKSWKRYILERIEKLF